MFLTKRSNLLIIGILSFVALLFAGAVVATGASGPEMAALLWLDPTNPTISTGQSGLVDLRLDDVTNVYGAQVDMAFDPTNLSVVGGSVSPGVCPEPDFVATNTASGGAINYVVTQLNPTPPCDGGIVATIEFMCAPGLTSDITVLVTISDSIISDLNGTPIPHSTANAEILCASSVFFVEGVVSLQAWPHSPAGVHVQLWNDTDAVLADEVVVGPDGAFTFAPEIDKLFTVIASYPRYLDIEESGLTSSTPGHTIYLGIGRLPVGDLNDDGVINILDLSVLAGNFLKSSPQSWAP